MAIRTGKVIIAKNIKLDKSYKNVLSYTETQMLNLVQSKKVAELQTCSFIKPGDNVIDTGFSYNDALKCNYLAMQNPLYSNKWFFAFIDEVEYISDGNSRIHYTIDEFATWFDYWNPKACFVIREHVNDDTIGLHTIPENLETGEMVALEQPVVLNSYSNGVDICLAVADFPSGIANFGGASVNGIYTGLSYCIFHRSNAQGQFDLQATIDEVNYFISKYDNDAKADAIQSIFLIPREFSFTDHASIVTYDTTHFFYIPNEQTTYNTLVESASVISPNHLGGNYIPKNNKLLTGEFNYFFVSNNAGTDVEFHYEDFTNNLPTFKIIGAVTPGCSIKCVPRNYKKIIDGTDSLRSYDFGIDGCKLPICAWTNDTYTNWLTSNGTNVALGVVGGAVSIGLGIATGGAGLVVAGAVIGGGMSIASSVASVKQHQKAPDQARGNVTSGDVNYASGNATFVAYRMGLREEYAKVCDDYLSRFGYKINRIKTPNQSGRLYWNFVQIGAEEDIGYSTNTERSVPTNSMDIINNIYRTGVTIWHDHDQLGNYNLENNIL